MSVDVIGGCDEIELGVENGMIGKIIHPVYGDITEEVAVELSKLHGLSDITEERCAAAAVEARELAVAAEFMGLNRGGRHALGRQRLRVPAVIYHYWGQRLGYECWQDSGFLKWVERHFEELRVREAKQENRVGWKPAAVLGGVA